MKSIKIILLFAVSLFFSENITAQIIPNRIIDPSGKGIPGVLIRSNSTNVFSDANGYFDVPNVSSKDTLLISAIGFSEDTIRLSTFNNDKIIIRPTMNLAEVQVVEERSGTMVSIQTIQTEIITSKELKKAACCNLGEAFETNATVDISYKDAITGSKEIQVMGNSGAYTQILTENTPVIYGLGLTYGLNYIPGTQINTISLVKGPGSVVFGPESMSGMINIDLKDPEFTDKYYVNAYVDQNLRREINLDLKKNVAPKLNTLLSVHANQFTTMRDNNGDGFMNMPRMQGINILNKWKYSNRGLFSQNSIRYINDLRQGGEVHADYSKTEIDSTHYTTRIATERVEFYGRTGKVLPSESVQSIGLQYSLVSHDQQGFYGLRKYSGRDQFAFFRLIYANEYFRNHAINVGLSLNARKVDEVFSTLDLSRNEITPGIFAEDSWNIFRKAVIILGMRADWLNGNFNFIKRANVKYSIVPEGDLRLTYGEAYKSVNVFAENPAFLVSNKNFVIAPNLGIEKSKTLGISFNKEFRLDYRKGSYGVDFYTTKFDGKVIPNLDKNPTEVYFANSQLQAYSNSFQANFSYKILKPIEFKASYKYLDVFERSGSRKIAQYYVPNNRFLVALSYVSFNRKWASNISYQFYGHKKLPLMNGVDFDGNQFKSQSPNYSVVNIQLTRTFKNIEIYSGAENLFNFIQTNNIIGASDPFSQNFDASYVWGPLEGRRIYAGIRMNFN